ncbi:alpha/beta hydrolase [Undibacterium terreum]|uniref:Alpha/beta hydrolase n=1 Tax=Undibacterium terreum TaxID=1224302 RepID=A0A916XLN5_9BURK|nr:alpha/beta hydrolase [Undibacterium terreum]GGC84731.1 hypothetical protein GCM10011396_35070 [Undibacterium terreum]
MTDFIMTVRAAQGNGFSGDVGQTLFLEVPTAQMPSVLNSIPASVWYAKVLAAAAWKNEQGEDRGDILFIVHGYNNSEIEVIERHRILKEDLLTLGFKGAIVSFDWPSGDKALAYIEDRHKAKITALKLVTDGIAFLSGKQTPSCPINVHVLGHSMGAFVIREAFDDADDTQLSNSSWNISQLAFAAGDVSSSSMIADDSSAESLYRHCVRITNYSNRYDQALDISNAKRLGTAPRVGRIGLPSDIPSSAVNVDCSAYYQELTASGSATTTLDEPRGFKGVKSHSWFFGNAMFTRDLFDVLIGVERTVIKTRTQNADGALVLIHI